MFKLNVDAQTLQKLEQLTQTTCYMFLGFKLDLSEGTLSDRLANDSSGFTEWHRQLCSVLLNHYASANHMPPTNQLTKFKDLPGGSAYEKAFSRRAIEPVAEVFGEKPDELPRAAKLLGGIQLELGDASAEIPALKGIPLTYILWGADEFTASANILYNPSASNYLPTEDLAVLGELTTMRLIEAKGTLNR